MSLLQGLGFQIKEAYPIAFCKCVVFIAWLNLRAKHDRNISLESKLRFSDIKATGFTFLDFMIPFRDLIRFNCVI